MRSGETRTGALAVATVPFDMQCEVGRVLCGIAASRSGEADGSSVAMACCGKAAAQLSSGICAIVPWVEG